MADSIRMQTADSQVPSAEWVLVHVVVCSETGAGSKWDEVIYPGMKASVINTLIATQEHSETRKVRSTHLS